MAQVVDVPQADSQPVDKRKLGMWLFLASEVMFFTSLIGGFVNMKGRSPAGANHVLNIPVTAVNTFILILSSTLVVLALASAQNGKMKRAFYLLLGTWFLGALFLGIQVNEYIRLIAAGVTPSGSLFGSGFYALTGFHGLHVVIGLSWLTGLLVMAVRGLITQERSYLIEMFGLFWHFVDVVWIVLFTIVYLL
jgi:heme/copper-type cytochrome/quinol oxidase subunit 3